MRFQNVGLVLLVLLGSHIYKRLQALWALDGNAPGKLSPISTFRSYDIKYAAQLKNCEDALLIGDHDGWALLSCDSGRDNWNTVMGIFNEKVSNPQGKLYLWNYASPSAAPLPLNLLDFPSGLSDFHPLGIEYHPASKSLYVVNHAVAGSRLEIFTLYLEEQSATHIRTIVHPLIHSPNAIAGIDKDNIYLTNDHFFLVRYHPWLALLETYLAIPIGNVVHIHLPTTTIKRVARIPFANGIKLLDETTVVVASTGTSVVNFYDRNPATQGLTFREALAVPFLPDNLDVDSQGGLLIAGHGHIGAVNKFSKTRALCRYGHGHDAAEACKLTSTSVVAEWTEQKGLRILYLDDKFSTSSTAIRDTKRGVGIVTGLFEDGLLVWKQ